MAADASDDPLRGAIALHEFAPWTRAALEPFGFTRENALTLVAVCRDELMVATEHGLSEQWGPAFDLTSLGAFVFLGRSGLAAAVQHAPGLDGRRRFVVVVLPHIGVGADGAVGAVERFGLEQTSNACGALIALRDQLDAGPIDAEFDVRDPEMSMIRMAVAPHLHGEVPSLVALTELARQISTAEVVALCREEVAASDVDIAVVSGIVVHHADADRVVVREAWVTLGSDPTRVPLTR